MTDKKLNPIVQKRIVSRLSGQGTALDFTMERLREHAGWDLRKDLEALAFFATLKGGIAALEDDELSPDIGLTRRADALRVLRSACVEPETPMIDLLRELGVLDLLPVP